MDARNIALHYCCKCKRTRRHRRDEQSNLWICQYCGSEKVPTEHLPPINTRTGRCR